MMDLDQLVGISVPLTTIFALAVIALLYLWLRKQDAGTEHMQEIAHFIQVGANVFLRREFLTIAPFVALLALLWLVAMPAGTKWQISRGFVVGDTFGDPLKDTAGPSLHILKVAEYPGHHSPPTLLRLPSALALNYESMNL